jgi:REP-associated tyrosine transposase
LHHDLPPWVTDGSLFHVRVRCEMNTPIPLTDQDLAAGLLESVRRYAESARWWPLLFLLMPDHWHAILGFPGNVAMSGVIGDWKRFHARVNGVVWQDNYFDHRLRRDESLVEKEAYIRNNPVVKGLCKRPEDWPWVVSMRTG